MNKNEVHCQDIKEIQYVRLWTQVNTILTAVIVILLIPKGIWKQQVASVNDVY